LSTLTKKQHYVWAHHLRAWEEDGALWCHRFDEDKLFRTNSLSLANETYFYRIQELTAGDLAALELLITRNSNPEHQRVNRGWIEYNQMPFALRRTVEQSNLKGADKAQALAELDAYEKIAIERWHSRIEENFQAGLLELREGRSGFYADIQQRNAFITYLSFQYFRTANMRQRMRAVLRPIGDYDPTRTWGVEALIFSTNVGASLSREQAAYKIGFLENATPSPFITADQPVINLLPGEGEDLMFYFPISPRRAIVFGPAARVGDDRRELSQIEVERRNHQIFCRSVSQTYAADRDYLAALVKLGKIDPAA
jgi:hypothetical protein